MNSKLFFSLVFINTTLLSNAKADDTQEPLRADIEFGWITTGGNTNTTSTKAIIDIKHDTRHWRHNYIVNGFSTQNIVDDDKNTETTAEKYSASMKNVYKIDTENAGLFLFSYYEIDQFSGYEYQGSISAGYANRLFETPKSYFDFSIGPGFSFDRVNREITREFQDTATTDAAPADESPVNDKNNSLIARIDLNYQYELSKSTRFEQEVSADIADSSDKNTRVKLVSAVTATLNNSLALKISYTINRNSLAPDVAADEDPIKNSNTQSSITLVYSF